VHQVDHTKNIIELQNISFTYGQERVLNNLSLNIHLGDYLGIIGPNGGGKTTLLKIMLGLLPNFEGQVKLFGKDLKDFPDWYKIGYVPQKATNFDLNFPATIEETVAMGRYGRRGLFKLPTNEDNRVVTSVIAEVDLTSEKDQLIGNLSGGQQQRVFIARALASEPEVIILDEPTVSVDPETQDKFYKLLRDLNDHHNLTLVLVSHDLDIITSQTTEVACINHSLIYHGSSENFNRSYV